MHKLLIASSLAIAACAAQANDAALAQLESFLQSARSGRAEFTQVVTSPARAGQPARSKTSTGTFEFQRPDRFRFVYRKPFEQTLVADGQTLWLHDVDLNQVTARKQSQALGATPAALVASSPDLATLRRDFDLKALPDQDGLQWVQATPKVRDGQLAQVKVGLRNAQLAVLDILDGFGQRSVITFNGLQVNAAVAPDAFRFTPPAGADVLRP